MSTFMAGGASCEHAEKISPLSERLGLVNTSQTTCSKNVVPSFNVFNSDFFHISASEL